METTYLLRQFAATALLALTALTAIAASDQAALDVSRGHTVRDGIAIDFEARPLEGTKTIMEGGLAEIRFRLSDERTGKPIAGLIPSAWMDMGHVIQGRPGTEQRECKDKISLYLQGIVGIRPMIDLSNYYVLVLNQDASITVVDPMVTMAGRTSTYTSVILKRQPMDWAQSVDGRLLFVTMPLAHEVAVVDTERFIVKTNIPAGKDPVRIAVQPDGRYLWVGDNARNADASGVTVIDAQTLRQQGFFATGRGHHEIAFSPDSRYAFVSNRDDGTVSVFDVGSLKKIKDVKTGSLPISIAYSDLSGSLLVSDAKDGTVTVIDGRSHERVKTITAKAGLGPLRFTRDGLFAMVVNTRENTVSVIDPALNEIIHTIPVAAEPYQLAFSRAFAYVRGLASERVTMINLASLGKGKDPIVQSFVAGAVAPKAAGDLPIADSMATAKAEATLFVVNPSDNSTYFYMEGMNAPSSSYLNRGHNARAVSVVDRSLKEVEPGVFTTKVRVPVAGRYDIALLLDQPRIAHCFSAEAKEDPLLQQELSGQRIEYLMADHRTQVGQPTTLRFKLTDPAGKVRSGVRDVKVKYFLAPASRPVETIAKEVGDGVYEAVLKLSDAGVYYAYVASRSLKMRYNDLPYVTLHAMTEIPATSKRE